eukprot:9229644-Pyramimonas_sp.AAC.1
MSTAANCMYGSTLSPPRLKQLREGVWKHMDSCGSCDQDDLFLFYLPHIRRQMKEVMLSALLSVYLAPTSACRQLTSAPCYPLGPARLLPQS